MSDYYKTGYSDILENGQNSKSFFFFKQNIFLCFILVPISFDPIEDLPNFIIKIKKLDIFFLQRDMFFLIKCTKTSTGLYIHVLCFDGSCLCFFIIVCFSNSQISSSSNCIFLSLKISRNILLWLLLEQGFFLEEIGKSVTVF